MRLVSLVDFDPSRASVRGFLTQRNSAQFGAVHSGTGKAQISSSVIKPYRAWPREPV